LSTRLVDVILHQTMKQSLPENVLIGTSLCMTYFDVMTNKTFKQDKLDTIRQKYLPFSADRFHFLAAACFNSHFFVIHVTFNGGTLDIFENVTVYDSMRGASTNNEVNSNTEASTPFSEGCNSFLFF
jgi:hypothetical protein